jgi:hypothetical protein
MTFRETDRQISDARAFIQGAALAAALMVGVTGCAASREEGPESWWHEAIGGKIAQDRPAPPGDKDPAPNLATVPPKPAPVDAAAWNRRTAGLMTDRVAAREAAALAPIPAATPAASSGLPGAPPPRPTLSGPTSVPGLGPAEPSRAPKDAPSGLGASLNAVAKPAAPAPVSSRLAPGPLPALPVAPPTRPGIAPPPPARLAGAGAVPPVAPTPAPGVTTLEFVGPSDQLTTTSLDDLRAIAAGRGEKFIVITGRGDAVTSDAVAQAAAVGLALRRAQAIATALVADGVPNRVLRIDAQAAGRGGDLRLLQ